MTNAKTARVEFESAVAAFRVGRHTFRGGRLAVTEAEAEPIRDFAATHPRFGIAEVARTPYTRTEAAPPRRRRTLDVSGPGTLVGVDPVPEPEHPRRRRRAEPEPGPGTEPEPEG